MDFTLFSLSVGAVLRMVLDVLQVETADHTSSSPWLVPVSGLAATIIGQTVLPHRSHDNRQLLYVIGSLWLCVES